MYTFQILVLDQSGLPKEWVSQREAILYHAVNKVDWQLGTEEIETIFRGGVNKQSGELSQLKTAPIISLHGDKTGAKRMGRTPIVTNKALFRRDCYKCAYCGQTYKEHLLSRDHIIPTSKGGPDIWNNVITACKNCNRYKGDKLLSEIDLPLRFSPYTPNHAESLILENPNILDCQTEYLLTFISAKSRINEYLTRLIEYRRKIECMTNC